MLKTRAISLWLFLVHSVPLWADTLSCDPPQPSVLQLLNSASKTNNTLEIGYGRFAGGPTTFGESDGRQTATTYFSGVFFREGRIIPAVQTPVTVTAEMTFIYTGYLFALEGNENYLVLFAKDQTTAKLSLLSAPCVDPVAIKIDLIDIEKAAKCLATGTCTAAGLRF